MSLVDHPAFLQLKPWLEAQEKKRDGGIWRIELLNNVTQSIRSLALGVQQPCVKCGDLIYPFRWREAKGQRGAKIAKNIYYGATCKEMPDIATVTHWQALVNNPNATIQQLKEALLNAAKSYKTCGKGKAASIEYGAIAKALGKT